MFRSRSCFQRVAVKYLIALPTISGRDLPLVFFLQWLLLIRMGRSDVGGKALDEARILNR